MADSRWSLMWARPGVVCAMSGLGCRGALWWACASGVVCRVSLCPSPSPGVPWGSRDVDWVWRLGAVLAPCVWCVPLLPVLLSSAFPIGVAPALSCAQCWWPSGGTLPPCCVVRSALFSWVCARHLVPFHALLLPAFPLTFPFPMPWWWGAGEVCGASMAHTRGWAVSRHRQMVSGV